MSTTNVYVKEDLYRLSVIHNKGLREIAKWATTKLGVAVMDYG